VGATLSRRRPAMTAEEALAFLEASNQIARVVVRFFRTTQEAPPSSGRSEAYAENISLPAAQPITKNSGTVCNRGNDDGCLVR
jgi:hypothetical protein